MAQIEGEFRVKSEEDESRETSHFDYDYNDSRFPPQVVSDDNDNYSFFFRAKKQTAILFISHISVFNEDAKMPFIEYILYIYIYIYII